MSGPGNLSRRGALGAALLGLPFAGNLAEDVQDAGTDSNTAEAAEGRMTFHLEALREDGSTVLAASPVQLDDVESVLADAGFRIHRHGAPKRAGSGAWSRSAASRLPRKGKP